MRISLATVLILASTVTFAADEPDAKSDNVAVAIRKKLNCKVQWKEKTGELTLTYDFPSKVSLGDFEVGTKRVAIANHKLAVEAGDELRHVAKFKTFTASTVVSYKEAKGAGIGSSNGASLLGHSWIQFTLNSPDTSGDHRPVRNYKFGGPLVLNVVPDKVLGKLGKEVMTAKMNRPNDIHQVVLHGGLQGCAFSDLVITGVPDPEWFKEITKE